jgi:hypothetical protein
LVRFGYLMPLKQMRAVFSMLLRRSWRGVKR